MVRMLGLILMIIAFGGSATATETSQPLSLADCLRIAYERHPDLAVSQALLRMAEARVKETHAGYLPRWDLGASYTRQTYNFAASPGTTPRQVRLFASGESFTNAPYYYGGTNFSQTLYDFGHTRGAVSHDTAEMNASRLELSRLRQTIALNVRTAYFDVLAAQELVKVRQLGLDNQNKHLEQVRAFFEVGTRPKIDVTKQEVAVSNAEVDLRQAEEGLKVAQAALATAMGLPIEQAPEPVNVLRQERPREDLAQLLAEAERNRPDVQSARERIAAARADRVVAQSAFRPNISLSSFFNYRNLAFPLIYNWSVGELLAQNLYAGGADRARVEEAKAEEEAAQASLDSLIQKVRLEVFTAYSDLDVSADKIRLALKAEEEAQENLELAEGRYQNGYGNIIELTDAQFLATDSQAREITARDEYQTAAGRLDAAVGREGP